MLYLGKIAFSPNSRRYAFTQLDGSVQVNDSESGQAVDVYRGHTKPALGIDFSADGKYFVTGSMDATVMIRDLGRDSSTDGGDPKTIQLPNNPVLSVSISPDSHMFATASVGDNRALRIWDIADPREKFILDYHAEAVYEARFSPDGSRIASAGLDKLICVWDLSLQADRKGSLEKNDRVFKGHSGDVTSIDFSPDGRSLVSGSYDRTVRIWDIATGQTVREVAAHADPVTAVRYIKPGMIVSASFDKTIKVWDADLNPVKTLGPYEYGVQGIAVSRNGKYFAAFTKYGPIAGKASTLSA
jgi:WD40 repeat protein